MPTATTSSFTSLLPSFLLAVFRKNPGCHILHLPLDIHVDNIFCYLTVEDIICLRRTCISFFLLTHEPAIWKRFLERMNLPIPPLRPSFRYSLQATDYEVEQLVTRAISVDDSWRCPIPTVYSRSIFLAHNKVLDMAIVPGGKFLVASMVDEGSYRHFLTLFHLDCPAGPRAVARTSTFTKAYNLKAKYMIFKGRIGLMIAYARRLFENGPVNCDPSYFSHRMDVDVDPPQDFRHEVVVLHMPLTALEELSDPDIVLHREEYARCAAKKEAPFILVESLVLMFRADMLDFFEFNSLPYLSVVQDKNTILSVDLTTKQKAFTLCEPHPNYPHLEHRIGAIRMLPKQREMLVIRFVHFDQDEVGFLVEIYDSPRVKASNSPKTSEAAKYRYHVRDGQSYSSVSVSDFNFTSFDTSLDHPRLKQHAHPPPPISLFFHAVNPQGFLHHNIYPEKNSRSEGYKYTLKWAYPQSAHISSPHVTRVLPGAHRSILYTVLHGERRHAQTVLNLRRYVNPDHYRPSGGSAHADFDINGAGVNGPVTRRSRLTLPKKRIRTIEDYQGQFLHSVNQCGGVAAIVWDESIGRLCVAVEGEHHIRILDCAQVVQPDARFAAWKRRRKVLSPE